MIISKIAFIAGFTSLALSSVNTVKASCEGKESPLGTPCSADLTASFSPVSSLNLACPALDIIEARKERKERLCLTNAAQKLFKEKQVLEATNRQIVQLENELLALQKTMCDLKNNRSELKKAILTDERKERKEFSSKKKEKAAEAKAAADAAAIEGAAVPAAAAVEAAVPAAAAVEAAVPAVDAAAEVSAEELEKVADSDSESSCGSADVSV